MNRHYLEHLARRGLADIHPHGADASAALVAALLLNFRQRVLEVGCGTGRTLARVARKGAQMVTGVDVMPAMLATARRRLSPLHLPTPVHLLQASATHLPFAPAAFTRVYTESVLGFQDEPTARHMLAAIHRVLVPGGRYVANEAVWRRGVSPAEVTRIYESCLADFGLCQASPQPWDVDDWCAEMERAGFRVLSTATVAESLPSRPAAGTVSEAAEDGRLPLAYRLQALAHPRILWDRLHYRRLLARHKDDGQAMESRLFILEKI